jgi:uncharacterized coiled-coil DUF342 family protein
LATIRQREENFHELFLLCREAARAIARLRHDCHEAVTGWDDDRAGWFEQAQEWRSEVERLTKERSEILKQAEQLREHLDVVRNNHANTVGREAALRIALRELLEVAVPGITEEAHVRFEQARAMVTHGGISTRGTPRGRAEGGEG